MPRSSPPANRTPRHYPATGGVSGPVDFLPAVQWLLAALLAFPALCVAATPPRAGTSTRLDIQATVLKMLQVSGARQPDSVLVTTADIARGYVDVPAAVVFDVKTNNPAGYAVHLRLLGEAGSLISQRGAAPRDLGDGNEDKQADAAAQSRPFRAATAKWDAQSLAFGKEGAMTIFQKRGPGMAMASHQLAFRLALAAGSAPGRYEWPVTFFVTPA